MVDVAGGIEPAVVNSPHSAGVIDVQPAARRQSYCLQADVVGSRCSAGGEEYLVDPQLGTVVQLEDHWASWVGAAQRAYRYSHAHVNAGVGQSATDEFPHKRFHSGQQARSPSQQGHRGAQSLPGGRHLHTDAAGADDRKPVGDRTVVGGLAIGPWPGFGDARKVGECWPASGADDNGMPGGQRHAFAARLGDDDAARTVQSPVTAYQRRADSTHPVGLAGVVPVGHIAVAAAKDAGCVDRAVDCFARAVDPSGVRDRDDRTQQGFAGHTGPIGAFTPDEFALHHRDTQAPRAGTIGDVLSNGSRAEHDDVIRFTLTAAGCCHWRLVLLGRGHNQRSFRRTLPATLRAPSAGEPCRPIAHQTQKLSTRRAKRDLYVSVSVLCVPRGGCVGVTDAVSRWFVPDHLVSGSLCVCRPLGVGVEQYCRH
ncbi:Uncharacterised protein [Mycobacterium tuberculosis]|nr:Uncharacterised protein [Mycobacterium tuberculosis]CNV43833.1 Uncharacterised protein [Mycobacterium tuberculosis]